MLIDAKKSPGAISFGSTGVGTSNHLYPLLLANQSNVTFLPVPYQGGGGAFLPDLIAGRYDFVSGTMGFFLPHVNAGKLKALATGGLTRSPLFPNEPTISETFPGFEAASWVGLIAPAGLSKEKSDRLREAIKKTFNSQPTKDQLISEGFVIEVSTSAQFVERVKKESEQLGKVIRDEKIGE